MPVCVLPYSPLGPVWSLGSPLGWLYKLDVSAVFLPLKGVTWGPGAVWGMGHGAFEFA